ALPLGQVLLTADDFLITDFEGEPARSIEERREKASPLRDIAGMLRSFDYARAVALEHATSVRPDLAERLGPAFDEWRRQTAETFLAGYRSGVGPASFLPTEPTAVERLLLLFQLEKAFYELRYELNNRPTWAWVPIEGLLTLLRSVY